MNEVNTYGPPDIITPFLVKRFEEHIKRIGIQDRLVNGVDYMDGKEEAGKEEAGKEEALDLDVALAQLRSIEDSLDLLEHEKTVHQMDEYVSSRHKSPLSPSKIIV